MICLNDAAGLADPTSPIDRTSTLQSNLEHKYRYDATISSRSCADKQPLSDSIRSLFGSDSSTALSSVSLLAATPIPSARTDELDGGDDLSRFGQSIRSLQSRRYLEREQSQAEKNNDVEVKEDEASSDEEGMTLESTAFATVKPPLQSTSSSLSPQESPAFSLAKVESSQLQSSFSDELPCLAEDEPSRIKVVDRCGKPLEAGISLAVFAKMDNTAISSLRRRQVFVRCACKYIYEDGIVTKDVGEWQENGIAYRLSLIAYV